MDPLKDSDFKRVSRLVDHMSNNYRHMFHIPSDLTAEVKGRVNALKAKRAEHPRATCYCQQVSTEEYQLQKEESSHQHLVDLLDIIINDENMTTRMRKKRLKQVSGWGWMGGLDKWVGLDGWVGLDEWVGMDG